VEVEGFGDVARLPKMDTLESRACARACPSTYFERSPEPAFPGWYRILRCNGSDYRMGYNMLSEIEQGSHGGPDGEADGGALRLDSTGE
jgi:hypothetical protein